ncbi:hypothetical protein ROZALSC1DRAFT_20780 [Rozella allomycis CSF55]|uniref:Uncharacterized protein n=1 Tax=Rozella allomycis (strain CSF55) TaxID=988480 RepID=A0A4P9YN46_ROZAC|nr:hypothetical protein ROZALSC1DRAFT_20780 [Rozella allomycis CSF55]
MTDIENIKRKVTINVAYLKECLRETGILGGFGAMNVDALRPSEYMHNCFVNVLSSMPKSPHTEYHLTKLYLEKLNCFDADVAWDLPKSTLVKMGMDVRTLSFRKLFQIKPAAIDEMINNCGI